MATTTATPTQASLESAVAFDPSAQHTSEELADLAQSLNFILDAITGAEGNDQEQDLRPVMGDEWVDWLVTQPADSFNDSLATVYAQQAELGETVTASPRSASPGSRAPSPVAAGSSRSASPGSAGGSRAPSPVARTATPPSPGGRRAAVPAAARARSASTSPVDAGRRMPRSSEREPPKDKKKLKSPAKPKVQDKNQAKRSQALNKNGIEERDLWTFIIPGEGYDREAPENKGKSPTQLATEKRAATVEDYYRTYKKPFTPVGADGKPKGASKIPQVIVSNGNAILNLHRASVVYNRAFGKYSNDITVASIPKDQDDAITANYSDLEYIENILNQRVKANEYYVRALRLKPPTEKAPITAFKNNNRRIMLVPEAVNWVHTEAFDVPVGYGPVIDGREYTNLWEYITAATGVAAEQTYLWRGLLTVGNYNSLLRLVVDKIAQEPLPKLKKGEVRPKGPRRQAIYSYTQAMLDNFKKGKATLTTDKENYTGKLSVIDLLAKDKEATTFRDDVLLSSGVLILQAITNYSTDTASKADPKFFGAYSDAEHGAFVDESEAIMEFSDAYKARTSQVAVKEKEDIKLEKAAAKKKAVAKSSRARR
ncbi:Hypothetical protein POVR2_LOCUS408 [uncultured virus]|nr:Hypothetical protein POVR2_LOCUS408 [uncultured virus]